MARLSKILGPDGMPVRVEDLKRDVAAATIAGVRQPFSADPGAGLTPDRLAAILRRAEQGDPLDYFELAERIEEKDPHYLGVLSTRKRSVAQIDVTVEAASDDKAHQLHAETVRAWLKRDELQDELVDILDAIGKGVSFTEIIWDSSEGQWMPQRLEWRDPRWFTFSLNDGRTPLLRGGHGGAEVAAGTSGMGEPLMPFKFIVARISAKSGLPIRGGITRVASWAWMFKAFTQRDWAIFTQTYGQPIRIGKYGAGASEADKETLYRAVANIAGDCAAIMPESMMIEFIESKSLGASTDHYERRSDWLNREVSKAVLGQTTTTDAVSGGHAVSKEHRQVQEDIERADAKALSAVLNRDLVKPWIDLEYGPQKAYPRLVIARPEQRDVKMILDGIERGVPLGLKVAKSYLHDLLGIPEPAPDEELLEAPRKTAAPRKAVAAGPDEEDTREEDDASEDDAAEEDDAETGMNAAGAASRPKRDAVDRIAEEAEAVARPGGDLMIDAIRKLVDEAVTLEDVRDRLLSMAPAMPEDQLADLMRQAAAYALLEGQAEVMEQPHLRV